MNRELQQQLYKKYPKLFRQKDLSVQESCMPWGIDCGDGWFSIIDNLCQTIQNYVDLHNLPQVEFSQVKEKFGTLRIYLDHSNERVETMIDVAEYLSATTCEVCGNPTGKTQDIGGWIKTICSQCKALQG